MNINRTYGGSILKISLLAILLLVSNAGASSTVNVGYVNYDDSGFTGVGVATGNIFSNAIVGGPHALLTTDSVTYNGMNFTPLKRADISTANLSSYDTLILFEICDINTSLSPAQHAAINAYITSGHKVLLFDSDRCATGTGGKADYSWFTFPFATSSPGPRGAIGTLTIVENSTLTNGTNDLSGDPFNRDELGDANTATTSDPNWCAAAKTTNALGNNGFWYAYARNTGLIVYNGADNWFSDGPTKSLTDTFVNMLNQPFNPDGLPCSISLAQPKGSIAGTKFNDLNGDGTRQSTEPGLGGWNITLTNDTGFVQQLTTAPDGSYNLTNLTDGNYTVGEVIQPGWIQTAPAVSTTGSATYKVQISGGNAITGEDFGNFKLGSVSGMKFQDLNANGVIDPNEVGLTGWNITIKGTDTITGKTVNQTTTTDVNGNYNFTGLTAGTYIISETLKSGWVQTAPLGGTFTVTITSGASFTGLNFGNFHKGKITGGGYIPALGAPTAKATFGIVGQYPDSSNTAQGSVEYQDHGPANLNIKSINITTVATTTDKTKGIITGYATVNGAGSYPFIVYVEDNGEPGKGVDVFNISLPTYPYSNGANLSYGNIQIHS